MTLLMLFMITCVVSAYKHIFVIYIDVDYCM